MQAGQFKNDIQHDNNRWQRCLLLCLFVPMLTACPVNSTGVDDEDLIAQILVQNNNGQASASVNFGASDVAGRNTVDLVAGESVSYSYNGNGDELRHRDDGEYAINLPSAEPGWYRFSLRRESEGRELVYRQIANNFVYLPNPFESVQVASVQSGPELTISWITDEAIQYTIDDFTTAGSKDSFNAIASCTSVGDNVFDVAITEAPIITQDGISTLDIPVAAHLQQVLSMSTDDIAVSSCQFDVQLVRTLIGVTDVALDRRSSATGQVLNNLAILWTAP